MSHINAVDGIYHVVRAFSDPDIIHEEGEVDPIRDIETINGELGAKDLQALVKIKEDINTRMKRAADKRRDQEELECMARVEEMLNKGVMVKDGEWSAKDVDFLNKHLFLTSKPVVYLVNIGRDEYIKKQNKWLPKIAAYLKEKGSGPMIPYSAEFEAEVAAVDPNDKAKQAAAAKELGAESVMDRIVKVGYKRLQLCHFFTAGEDEVRCWTFRDGSKAPQCAGVIHTDFEKGFICAEVMAYDDLAEKGSTQGVKDAGLYRQQGKDYEVKDGDVIFFRFNVAKGGKK